MKSMLQRLTPSHYHLKPDDGDAVGVWNAGLLELRDAAMNSKAFHRILLRLKLQDIHVQTDVTEDLSQ